MAPPLVAFSGAWLKHLRCIRGPHDRDSFCSTATALLREAGRPAFGHHGSGSGLPRPGDHQSLQSPLYHLSPHLRRTRTGEGHVVGAVYQHHRPVSQNRACGAAWGGRANAGERAAAHDPLFERPRSLRALQHQRHPVDQGEWAGTYRRRPGRIAGLARRRGVFRLSGVVREQKTCSTTSSPT